MTVYFTIFLPKSQEKTKKRWAEGNENKKVDLLSFL
jgi:hypothetical protein